MARVLLARNNPVIVADRRKALEAQEKELTRTHRRAMRVQKMKLKKELGEAHAREKAELAAAHAREKIVDLCEVLAIEITAGRRARLSAMASDELDALRHTIRTRRRWPDAL